MDIIPNAWEQRKGNGVYKKHFIIQKKQYDWERWENMTEKKYPTSEEARRAMKNLPKGYHYRIAESYTVVRYKEAKE